MWNNQDREWKGQRIRSQPPAIFSNKQKVHNVRVLDRDSQELENLTCTSLWLLTDEDYIGASTTIWQMAVYFLIWFITLIPYRNQELTISSKNSSTPSSQHSQEVRLERQEDTDHNYRQHFEKSVEIQSKFADRIFNLILRILSNSYSELMWEQKHFLTF